ncbi:MAG: hypothetical protein L3K14_06250 [Thermoplasmata archaeon]|nr:hypothetical protein [Thermoplasmata archaeon]
MAHAIDMTTDGSTTVSTSSAGYPGVVATIPVGDSPYMPAYNSNNGYVYVPNSLSNSVSVISGTSVVATIPVGPFPEYATYDSSNGYVYVTSYLSHGTDNVSVISGTSVLGTVPVGAYPQFPAYDSANQYLYVPNEGSRSVTVIHGLSVVGTVSVGFAPSSAVYDSGNGYVYVPNYWDNNVSVISGTSIVASVPVGAEPVSAAFDSGNGYVYVMTHGTSQVSVISNVTVVGTISIGFGPGDGAYDVVNGFVYVQGAGKLAVLSGLSLLATLSVGGNTPEYNNRTGYVYAMNFTPSGVVTVIDGVSVVARLPVGSYPSFATIDSGNGYVYVSNGGSSSVTAIATTYTVAFAESGNPSGFAWSITLKGTTQSSTSPQMIFFEPNGSYPFTVATAWGYAARPSSGSIAVNGTLTTVAVAIGPTATLYSVFVASAIAGAGVVAIGISRRRARRRPPFSSNGGPFQDPSVSGVDKSTQAPPPLK